MEEIQYFIRFLRSKYGDNELLTIIDQNENVVLSRVSYDELLLEIEADFESFSDTFVICNRRRKIRGIGIMENIIKISWFTLDNF